MQETSEWSGKNILLISVSNDGMRLAENISESLTQLGSNVRHLSTRNGESKNSVREMIENNLQWSDAFIFIMALGGTVRYLDLIERNKVIDPAVICIDDQGNFVIPVLSGHFGGANKLAESVSTMIGSTCVITSSSDSKGLVSIEEVARKLICSIANPSCTIKVNSDIVNGKGLTIRNVSGKRSIMLNKLGFNTGDDSNVVITNGAVDENERNVCYLVPMDISLGIGYRSGVSQDEITSFVKEFLRRHDLGIEDVDAISSGKNDGEAESASHNLGVAFKKIEREKIEGLNEKRLSSISYKARESLDIPGMSEPCALLSLDPGSTLLFRREPFEKKVTIAAAARKHFSNEGKIYMIGVGPGDQDFLTEKAIKLISYADVVAGYSKPLDTVSRYIRGKPVVKLTWKEQRKGVEEIIKLYQEGRKIAFLFTGDSCFSEAELISRFAVKAENIEIVPGISSVQVTSARSKFPLEICPVISLHITGDIEQRLQYIKQALTEHGCAIVLPRPYDMMPKVVCNYLIEKGLNPELPVRVYEKLTMEDETVTDSTLKELPEREYSDLTTMVIGHSPIPLDYIIY